MRPGDRVGVAAISGAVDPAALSAGLEGLLALGFEPVVATNVGRREAMLAGRDEERLGAFHELVDDPTLKAIFFARGGYGSTRILPAIDWRRVARHPRAYVGYSDVTPFLNQALRESGLATFHGPMIAADFARGLEAVEIESLLTVLAGERPAHFELLDAAGEAVVTAPVVGGCLSMIAATQGTPFAPPTEGAILFWEDVERAALPARPHVDPPQAVRYSRPDPRHGRG